MTAFKSDFLNVLQERGFVHQCSDFDALDALAAKGQAVGYVGYDCTAPSLHIGNFLTIMMLYWLQQSGNKPITLMGDGTTRVGDPSGKDETRAIRPVEEIDANKESIKRVFAKILKFGGKRAMIALDLYNALNSSAILTYNPAYVPGGSWLQPNSVLTARLARISAEFNF